MVGYLPCESCYETSATRAPYFQVTMHSHHLPNWLLALTINSCMFLLGLLYFCSTIHLAASLAFALSVTSCKGQKLCCPGTLADWCSSLTAQWLHSVSAPLACPPGAQGFPPGTLGLRWCVRPPSCSQRAPVIAS
jgi:hypothetical protein